MYSVCLYCHLQLGSNEVLEHFPIGRRLAFDGAKGRLWVICRSCERWNLTPLESRWEAVEQCERLYSSTRMRVATENIGLARLHEGLELVRIGEPGRTEFAAWRYGDHFGRRRRQQLIYTGIGTVAAGALMAGGIALGGGVAVIGHAAYQVYSVFRRAHLPRVLFRFPREAGEDLVISGGELDHLHLRPDEASGWSLTLWRLKAEYVFSGDTALRLAAVALPHMSPAGGSRGRVLDAIRFLEQRGRPIEAFAEVAQRMRASSDPEWDGDKYRLTNQPSAIRLALEMAAHEEQERRALEGELGVLERAWKEAEAIAAIADRLMAPASVEASLERLRSRGHVGEPVAAPDSEL